MINQTKGIHAWIWILIVLIFIAIGIGIYVFVFGNRTSTISGVDTVPQIPTPISGGSSIPPPPALPSE